MSGDRILVVDDDLSMREFLSILLQQEGYVVELAGSAEQAVRACEKRWPDLVLTDMNMPGASGLDLLRELKARGANANRDVEVVVVTAYGTAETAVEAMRDGAADYVLKPFNNEELLIVVRKALDVRRVQEENARLKQALQQRKDYDRHHFGRLVGSSAAMSEVYDLIRRVADSRIHCLIQGETGTGKEMVARAIHESGSRARYPFVAINCGAIPENLVESELFGHKRGAFTGAIRDKVGLMAAADRGTLFLDEVASLPLTTQVKLLRALQERKFTPVGAVDEVTVDVRVLSASNVDLEAMVRAGEFREDLFYRLNVVQVDLPALRDRVGDVAELVDHFVERFSTEYDKAVTGFTPEALRVLRAYSFPGNVRELQNVVERAVALCGGQVVQASDLPARIRGGEAADQVQPDDGFPEDGLNLDALLAATERKWLFAALEHAGGSKTEAARLLQMSFRSFRYRLAKYIPPGDQ